MAEQDPHIKRFSELVDSIHDSNLESTTFIAGQAKDEIRFMRMAHEVNRESAPLRAATVFGLRPMPKGSIDSHVPTIYLEPKIMDELDDQMLEGDIVRTLTLINQFAIGGFEDRLVDTYGRAIDQQKEWLNQTGVPEISNDPRFNERKQLLRHLLGPVKHTYDTGWDDYQAAINKLAPDAKSKVEARHNSFGTPSNNKIIYIVERQTQQQVIADLVKAK